MTENATDTAQGEWEREGVGVRVPATGTAWQIGDGVGGTMLFVGRLLGSF